MKYRTYMLKLLHTLVAIFSTSVLSVLASGCESARQPDPPSDAVPLESSRDQSRPVPSKTPNSAFDQSSATSRMTSPATVETVLHDRVVVASDAIDGIIDYCHVRAKEKDSDDTEFDLFIRRSSAGGQPVLFFRTVFHGRRWLFVESLTVVAGGKKYELAGAFKRSFAGGVVWEEYMRQASDSDVAMFRAITTDPAAVIRYRGEQRNLDHVFTARERLMMEDMLTAYRALGGKLPAE